MKKTKLHFLAAIMVVSILSSSSMFADGVEPPPQDDGVEPPPNDAPINQALPVLALLGVAFVYKAFQKAN